MPDEICTCTCGGAESEDHTPGIGCERRGCTCKYWPTEEFENTRTEVVKWYSITGIPAMESSVRKGTMLVPFSAKLTFLDGDCINLVLNGRVVKKNGEVSDRVVAIPGIYTWNQNTWPKWLHKLVAFAYSDFRAMKVPA